MVGGSIWQEIIPSSLPFVKMSQNLSVGENVVFDGTAETTHDKSARAELNAVDTTDRLFFQPLCGNAGNSCCRNIEF